MRFLLSILLLGFMLDGLGQITFEKNTTFQQDQFIASTIKQSVDSGFVLVGYKKIANFYVGCLMKTNKYGDTSWVKHYQRNGENLNISDIKNVENGYLLSCFCRDTNLAAIGYPIIVRTNLEGEILWSEKIQDVTYATNSVYQNKLILTEDGGFLYFFKRANVGLFAYKFNLDGTLEWSKNYYNSSISNNGNIDIIQKDGNYYFVWNCYFIKLNSDGEVIWKKNYKIPETGELLFPTSLASSQDGFILGCRFFDDNTGNRVCLINVDTIGNLLNWSFLFSENDDGEIFTISNTHHDGHVITYSTSISGEFTDYRIVKFDSSGNVMFSKNALNWSSAVTETYDNGYIFAYFDEELAKEYFHKIDSLGNTSCHNAYGSGNFCCDFNKDTTIINQVITYVPLLNNSIANAPIQIFRYGQNINTTCTSAILEEDQLENGFEIFPNPFTSEAKIVFNVPQTNTKIQLLDVLGKELQSVSFSGTEFTIYRESLSASMYFVQITDASGKVATKKIVLE